MTADQDFAPDAAAEPRPRPAAAALRSGTGGQTRVTAAGHGAVAEQILAIAFDRGIPVRQDADLAELLAALDIDSPIPLEALAAVSEILLYLYLAGRAPAAEARR